MSSPVNDMTNYTTRLNTFEVDEEHGLDHQTRTILAQGGFYYRGSGKSVACYKCGQIFYDWDSVHEVIDAHKESSPDCCRGIQETVHDGNVGCVYCGCELNVLELGDDPMVEHLRRFPECARNNHRNTNMSMTTTINNDARNTNQQPSSTERYGVEECQITNDGTETGEHHTIPTFEQLRQESLEDVHSLRYQNLLEENRDYLARYKEQTIRLNRTEELYEECQRRFQCTICMQRRADTLFLPCKHLCTCSDCASQVDHCCMCRSHISTSIKVYFP